MIPEDETYTRQKILIIDHDSTNIRELTGVLKDSYVIFSAIFGAEGIQLAEKELPDIMLLDTRLPDIDSFELFHKLKSNPKIQDIPIIFTTDLRDENNEAKFLEIGAVDYLYKPFNLAAVELRIRTQLELVRYKKQLENMVYERTEKLAQSNKRLREEIAERKRIEEKLLLQTTALEAAANAVVITDVKGNIIWVNKAFSQMTGYTSDEIIGKHTRILKSGRQDTSFYHDLWHTILSGNVWRGQLINRRKDGTMYTEQMIITPVRLTGDKITHFIAIKTDITADLEMNNRLRQSQKLEAIGALSAGIAHDFNNILYAIVGYSELLSKAIPANSKPAQHLDQILLAAKRAKDLISQILTFSRKSESSQQAVQVQSILKETLKLLRGALPSTIEIREHIDSDCGFIRADSTQIYQVIVNLCTNAFHAMKNKNGILEIALTQVVLDQEAIPEFPDIGAGKYVQLTVKDTGHGIAPDTIKKIFEPFFTTKPPGEGIGIGLSTVLSIVKSHKGAIKVQSEIGKGTVFDVFFPVYDHAIATQQDEHINNIPLKGKEHILIVDDEEAISKMIEIKLLYQGYQVSSFINSMDALNAFRKAPDGFDLIVTDQTMPKITGLELAAAIRKIRPDIPIILCSGYDDIVREEEMFAFGISKWFRKPLMGEELERAIRLLLNAKGSHNY